MTQKVNKHTLNLIKDLQTGSIAVNCKTQESANDFIDFLCNNIRDLRGCREDVWHVCGETTTFELEESAISLKPFVGYDNKAYYESHSNKRVVEWENVEQQNDSGSEYQQHIHSTSPKTCQSENEPQEVKETTQDEEDQELFNYALELRALINRGRKAGYTVCTRPGSLEVSNDRVDLDLNLE